MSSPLHELPPINLAPFCEEDTAPGVLETGEHEGNFFLNFDGEQHRTLLDKNQLADLAEQSGEPVEELDGMARTPQFCLSPKSALILHERLGDYLAKFG